MIFNINKKLTWSEHETINIKTNMKQNLKYETRHKMISLNMKQQLNI